MVALNFDHGVFEQGSIDCPRLTSDEVLKLAPLAESFLKTTTRSHKLGFYGEALLKAFLSCHYAHPMVADNVPIRLQSTTLGEIDFLFLNNKTQSYEHCEVAVKYYCLDTENLAEGELPALWRWRGPKKIDSLQNKISKSFAYLSTPSGLEAETQCLRARGLSLPVKKRKLLIWGRLFLPMRFFFNESLQNLLKLTSTSESTIRTATTLGAWIVWSDKELRHTLNSWSHASFRVCEKLEYISGKDSEVWLPLSQIEAQVIKKQSQNPTAEIMLQARGLPFEFIFILSEHFWPLSC